MGKPFCCEGEAIVAMGKPFSCDWKTIVAMEKRWENYQLSVVVGKPLPVDWKNHDLLGWKTYFLYDEKAVICCIGKAITALSVAS